MADKPTPKLEPNERLFYACPRCARAFSREEAGLEVCRGCGKCVACCLCRIEQGDF